jgi:CDP-diacylglycerol--glycerol-3-phosphate 3-phosphatidyltransferase
MRTFTVPNLPTTLTLFRIFMVPLVVVVLLTEFSFERWFFLNREMLAVLIFIIASITDILDGYLARKHNKVTTLGQLLDPIADKLLIVSVLISLVELKLVPAWLVVIIVGREFGVTGIRMIAALHQVVIPAGQLGKWKMVLQVIAICFIIGGNQEEWKLLAVLGNWMGFDLQTIALHWFRITGLALLYFVAFIAIISMIEYVVHLARKIDLFREIPH